MIRIRYGAPDTLPRQGRWLRWAACARPEYQDRADELWFAHDTAIAAVKEAKDICGGLCPVRRECLADALTAEGGAALDRRHGIRGGLTHRERLALYRSGKRAAA